jgi:formylmethanofuran dehydrogenase subunit E
MEAKQKSHLELKIVANSLQELERLIKWSEYLGFIHDGISQDNEEVYWTFLNIDNGLIESRKEIEEPKQNSTIIINQVCDLCNGLVDKEDKFTEEKHCVNCGWF